jgi:GH15 family glucan-1,4-alpha-glucosidase
METRRSKKIVFDKEQVLAQMESLRLPNGAFIAAPTEDYRALWLRDHLYATFAYWYLGEYEKLKQGVRLVFDIFQKYRHKIDLRLTSPIDISSGTIHAKYDAETLGEITEYWGHKQYDALGLFLHIVADLDFKNVIVIRGDEDRKTLQDVVFYLRSIEYWQNPDLGMWEECEIRHSSSIGAVVDGLSYIKRRRLAIVADPLIQVGEETLRKILPQESQDRCLRPHHSHDCDAAQLSLIWPYNIVSREEADIILARLIDGHNSEFPRGGESHKLSQTHGLNRYWGDDYYRSNEGKYIGISAEWPMFYFWISIIYSQRHDYKNAERWFMEGCKEIVDNKIPEAYQNGKPNEHMPLAWAHAIALIAFKKLPASIQQKFTE